MCPFEESGRRCGYKRPCGNQVNDDIDQEVKCKKRNIIVINFESDVTLQDADNMITYFRKELGGKYSILGTYKSQAKLECIDEDKFFIMYIEGTKYNYSTDRIKEIILKYEEGE